MSDYNAWSGNDSQGHDLPDLSTLRETIVFDVPTQTRANRMRIDGRNPIRNKIHKRELVSDIYMSCFQ